MKRIVAGLCFAILAVPAFAEQRGDPFQGSASDRGIPTTSMPHGTDRSGTSTRPPAGPTEGQRSTGIPARAAARGTAAGGASAATVPSPDPVWGKDHNFIAPAP